MTSYRPQAYSALIMVFLLAYNSGCSQPPPVPPAIIDKSPFTGIPCSAPCWHGLMIGKSSESDVRSILPTLTYLNQATIQYVQRVSMSGLETSMTPKGLQIYASCIQPSQPCLTLSIPDGVLAQIDILLNYQISINEIINDLGPPDYIGYQLMGVETMTCQVELVWYSKQLVLNSASVSWDSSNPKDNCAIVRDKGKIASNLIITGVSYKTIPWIKRALVRSGSEFFEFSGIIPEP